MLEVIAATTGDLLTLDEEVSFVLRSYSYVIVAMNACIRGGEGGRMWGDFIAPKVGVGEVNRCLTAD